MQAKIVWKKKRREGWRVGLLPNGQEPAVFLDSKEEPPEPGEIWEVPPELEAKISQTAQSSREHVIALSLALLFLALTENVVVGPELLARAQSLARLFLSKGES